MKNSKLLAAGVIVFSLTSCANLNVATSPYFQPEPGVVFKYGNFCGPTTPKDQLSYPLAERVSYLNSIEAADSIDGACKAHDLCYAKFGEDNFYCDTMISDLLSDGGQASTSYLGGDTQDLSCGKLALEMGTAFLGDFKRVRKRPNGVTPKAANNAIGGLVGAGLLVTNIASALNYGWPGEGTCHATRQSWQIRMRDSLPEFRKAALAGGCTEEELAAGEITPAECGIALSESDALKLTAEDMLGSNAVSSGGR